MFSGYRHILSQPKSGPPHQNQTKILIQILFNHCTDIIIMSGIYYSHLHLFLPLLLLLLAFSQYAVDASSANCTGSISTAELGALESLYYSTNGAKWLWRPNRYIDFGVNWTFPALVNDPCSLNWQGVVCTI